MVAKEISSIRHPLIQWAYRLRTEAALRKTEKRLLVSGRKLILDLQKWIPIEMLFYTDTFFDCPTAQVIHVNDSIMRKITGLQQSDGFAAIVPLPPEQNLENKECLLICDHLTDPGNLGTLWRTALALGWDGIWITPHTVDPFNDKVLRSAQGATFHLPYELISKKQILNWAKTHHATLYVADIKGDPIHHCKIQTPCALILSNESLGPGDWEPSVSQFVTISISSKVESLNVASAGAILLYAMGPHR